MSSAVIMIGLVAGDCSLCSCIRLDPKHAGSIDSSTSPKNSKYSEVVFETSNRASNLVSTAFIPPSERLSPLLLASF